MEISDNTKKIVGVSLVGVGLYLVINEYLNASRVQVIAKQEKTAAELFRESQTRATLSAGADGGQGSKSISSIEQAAAKGAEEAKAKGEKNIDVVRKHAARAALKAGAPTVKAAAAAAVSVTLDVAKQRPKGPKSESELLPKLKEALALYLDDRVIVAGEVLSGCLTYLNANFTSDKPEIQAYLTENQAVFDKFRYRSQLAKKSLGEFNLTDGWQLDSESFDVKTFFRIGTGPNGEQLLFTKLEAYFRDTPLFDTIAVINETDYFTRWMPMCSISKKLKQVARSEQVLHFNIGHLVLTRDCVMNAYGIDAMEDRATLILGNSVDEYPGVEMPPVSGWGAKRMFMHELKFLIEPITDMEARVVQITCIDMKMHLPEAILQFILKKVAALQLIMLRREARLIQQDGDTNPYRVAIKNNPTFYNWLRDRVEENKKLFAVELDLIEKLNKEGLEVHEHHAPMN